MNWALWKAKVTDDMVRFIIVDDLPASGFASVYNFSESDARSMENLGTFKSFKGTVHSPLLKLDCDTSEASYVAEKRLKQLEAKYEKYTTGNRGFHYHVYRSVEPSHLLPSIDRAFVTREFPGADVSFYHHVGMYRQVGAVHGKTGRKKTLIYAQDGRPLEMREEKATIGSTQETAHEGEIRSVFADTYLSRITVPYTAGERHNRFCAVAARLDDLNQPIEWAFAYLANVNLLTEDPLPESELRRILDWAYFQRQK